MHCTAAIQECCFAFLSSRAVPPSLKVSVTPRLAGSNFRCMPCFWIAPFLASCVFLNLTLANERLLCLSILLCDHVKVVSLAGDSFTVHRCRETACTKVSVREQRCTQLQIAIIISID